VRIGHLAFLLALSSPLAAQEGAERTWTLGAGLGGASAPHIAVAIGSAVSTAFTFGFYEASDISSSGARTLQLSTWHRRNGFTLSVSNEVITSRISTDGDPETEGSQRFEVIALLLGYGRRWFDHPHARIWSEVAVGGATENHQIQFDGDDPSSDTYLGGAVQLDLVGVSVGGALQGWFTLGFGFRGTGAIGASYTF
jgi:hypothetical protein